MNDNRYSSPGEYAVQRTKNAVPTVTSVSDDVDLGISEGDIRIVDAYFYELALDASEDQSPPTPEEKTEIAKLAASFERLKAMTREEMLAERVRRLRRSRRLHGE